ncbi:MAG: polyketide cyclase [Flaviaesturariibacter sp.]|nr:polyketide cyclase [Flaviaesturariibacter sp.]
METTTAMQTMKKSILINASKEAVWDLLTQDHHNRIWYAAFSPGTYAETDWKEGSKVVFKDAGNCGMIGVVKENKPGEILSIEYTGEIKNGVEDYDSEAVQAFKGGREIYWMKSVASGTQLDIAGDMAPAYFDWMSAAWDKALVMLKDLAEGGDGKVAGIETDRKVYPDFVIERTVEAPLETVYKAWTEANRLAQWWGPKGFDIAIKKLEVTPCGIFHYSMTLPNGQVMWGRFIYREVQAPERLVYINSFSDADGGITRVPFADNWPMEMLNELTLQADGDRTKLSLQGRPINATPEEEATYFNGHASMQQGFAGTFEQLEAYLAKEKALQSQSLLNTI